MLSILRERALLFAVYLTLLALFPVKVPYLCFFLVPVVRALGWSGERARRPLTATFAVLALLSLAIHVHGASSRKVYQWNSTPVDLDFHPERLWDWSDPQFLGRRS